MCVCLQVGALTSGNLTVDYMAPTISSVSATVFPTAGTTFVVTGANFGLAESWSRATNTPANQYAWLVFRDEFSTASPLPLYDCVPVVRNGVLQWNHSAIECVVPPGVSPLMTLILNVTGQAVSYSAAFFAYGQPAITALSPPIVQTQGACRCLVRAFAPVVCLALCARAIVALTVCAGGSVLTITGVNFGENGTVAIGQRQCAVLTYTHTRITCVVPEGEGANATVVVSNADQRSPCVVDARRAPPACLLRIYPPVIQGILPGHGAVTGDYRVEIIGSNFGTAASQMVYIDGRNATVLLSSHRNIVVNMLTSRAPIARIVVATAGQISNAASFLFDPPILGTLSPIRANATARDVTVTLANGVNFGVPASQQSDAQFNYTIWVGDLPCTGVSLVSSSQLKCNIRCPCTVGLREVVVQVNGQNSTNITRLYMNVDCAEGFHGSQGELCLPCPRGAVCSGGPATPVSLPGYVRAWVRSIPAPAAFQGDPRDVCVWCACVSQVLAGIWQQFCGVPAAGGVPRRRERDDCRHPVLRGVRGRPLLHVPQGLLPLERLLPEVPELRVGAAAGDGDRRHLRVAAGHLLEPQEAEHCRLVHRRGLPANHGHVLIFQFQMAACCDRCAGLLLAKWRRC